MSRDGRRKGRGATSADGGTPVSPEGEAVLRAVVAMSAGQGCPARARRMRCGILGVGHRELAQGDGLYRRPDAVMARFGDRNATRGRDDFRQDRKSVV